MDLFDRQRADDTAARAPLADRMRPRTLEEFAGQGHIVGPGRLLRRAIEADQLGSLIFFGPPGTGKTTLARIIANTTEAHFIALNAVLAGVKDIRAAVAKAEERRGMYRQRTILFIDEVHRFNKAQQDALLPWVENGTVIFVGATTENPYFEVNKALVSRSRVFQLRPLATEDLATLARAALEDPERGYGRLAVDVDADALDHLVDVANGDARALLNALELAVETTPPGGDGRIRVDLAVAEESIQRRAVLYDKEGDVHYDTISAFIKSVRGSDPDAALYWLARMVYAGEDPRFIFRRLLILAAEDVGLAAPDAVRVVVACAQAYDYVGLPEGQFHLSEATLYLATAPKSNTTLAYFDALDAVQRERADDVPKHLKDASRDTEAFGHGAGYLYPHAYREHWVAQQYLPKGLQGRLFYQPSDQGHERAIRETTARRREAQLAAMVEGALEVGDEPLTWTGSAAGRARDRWLARALGDAGARLEALRARVIDGAALRRHSRVLDLRAQTGLLTWEAMRRAPEGGVWALVEDADAAAALTPAVAGVSDVDAPAVLVGSIAELPELLALRGEADVRFDAVVGRNALAGVEPADWAGVLAATRALLAPGGRISLAEAAPGLGSWPSDLVAGGADGAGDAAGVVDDAAERSTAAAGPSPLVARLRAAEADIVAADPRLAWGPDDLAAWLANAGFDPVRVEVVDEAAEIHVTPSLVARWFDAGARYAAALAAHLAPEDVAAARAAVEAHAGGPARPWRTVTVYATGRAADGSGGGVAGPVDAAAGPAGAAAGPAGAAAGSTGAAAGPGDTR